MDSDLHILLIDDSAADVLITRKIIERNQPAGANVRITEATRLSQAETLLRPGGVDCMLLDLHLPDGRGLGNIATLRSVAPAVPIVVLSGSQEDDAEQQMLASGASAYIQKQSLREAGDIYAILIKTVKQATHSVQE